MTAQNQQVQAGFKAGFPDGHSPHSGSVAVFDMLLNLFHATAQANAEGKHLLPDSVVKIRDQANLRKLTDARKLLSEFLSQEGPGGGER